MDKTEIKEELENRREYLKDIYNACGVFKGAHKEVADKLKRSPSFLFQVKNGDNATKPIKQNLTYINKASGFYEDIIKREYEKIKNYI